MPCAMSSLRGASGVVGCDRVVCPLVLHATTIAHLDVLLCTLLCFLLCAVLLCGAVPLSCGAPCVLPALPVVRLRGAVAVVCGFVLPLLSLLLWVCATVRPVLPVPCLPYFLGVIPTLYMGVLYAFYDFEYDTVKVIPTLYMGVLYAGLVHSLYACPIF